MKMNEEKKSILLIVLIVILVSMTIAYAALSTTLSIAGTAQVSQTTWDIHFANFENESPATTSLGETNTGVLKSVTTNATKIENLKVDLKKPGDKIVYTFDIINSGTVDAKLSLFNKTITCESDNTCSYATYTVTCLDENNQNALVQGSYLQKNKSINCTLTIKYNEDASISDDVGADLTADFQFVQK